MSETNKCNLCGLKVRIQGKSKLSDTDFVELQKLKEKGIIKKRFLRNPEYIFFSPKNCTPPKKSVVPCRFQEHKSCLENS